MGNFDTIQQFGENVQTYQFPDTVESWKDNFKTLRTMALELPGRDGGLDQYGSEAAPSADGELTVRFWLLADTPAIMQTLKDELYATISWGKRKLWRQPYGQGIQRRYCNARVKRIEVDETAEDCSWRNQRVVMTFHVPEARWFVPPTGPVWGDPGTKWGQSGVLWGETAGTAYSAPQLLLSVSYAGTAQVPVSAQVVCGTGQQVTNPRIERLVQGIGVESVEFIGTVSEGETLLIDAARLRANKAGVSVFGSLNILRATWLSVVPGENVFRLVSGGGTDSGLFKVSYQRGYY